MAACGCPFRWSFFVPVRNPVPSVVVPLRSGLHEALQRSYTLLEFPVDFLEPCFSPESSERIGPLHFYSLPVSASGIDTEVILDQPQKGAGGDYEATVNSFKLVYTESIASLSVTGTLTKQSDPDWQTPLRIEIYLGENDS